MSDFFKLEPCDLEYQKIIEDINCEIEFCSYYVKVAYNFYAEEPIIEEDINSGWEEKEVKFECTILKKFVYGFDKVYFLKNNVWCLFIFYGSNTLRIHFKNEKKLDVVYNFLTFYLNENTDKIS